MLAATAAGGWLLVPALPGMAAAPASVARAAPMASPSAINPVDAIASLRDDRPGAPAVPLASLRTDAPTSGYLPIAVLDRYDGDTWTFDRTFDPTGGRVPPPPPGTPGTSGHSVTAHLTLLRPLGPDLPFVPYLDRPSKVGGLAVDADPRSGMVVPAGRLRYPTSYEVTAAAPAQAVNTLPAATALDTAPGGDDTSLPADAGTNVTGVLRYLATETGTRPGPDAAFLRAVVALFDRADRRVNPEAVTTTGPGAAPPTRGGTSLAEVIDAITVNQQGTPEQYATLFVIVARSLGVPARLVTGLRVPGADVASVPAGTRVVTNRDAWTWAELPVAGVGWVPVDPTPTLTASSDQAPPQAGVQTPSTTLAPPQADAVPSNAAGGHALAAPSTIHILRHHRSSSVAVITGGVVVALLVLMASALGLSAGRRLLRRRSRRSTDPGLAALGAWLEVLDDLWRAGVVPPVSATGSEVAAFAGAHFGIEVEAAIRQVGDLADRALCSTKAPVEEATARAAWAAQRRAGRSLRRLLPRTHRVRGFLAVGAAPRRPVTRRVQDRPSLLPAPPPVEEPLGTPS